MASAYLDRFAKRNCVTEDAEIGVPSPRDVGRYGVRECCFQNGRKWREPDRQASGQ